MNSSANREALVAACLNLSGDGLGFALPLLQDPGESNVWLVQEVDELSGVVAGFKILEGDVNSPIPVANGPTSRVGGPLIYAFVTEDGVGQAGTLVTLGPLLQAFIIRRPERSAIKLQIAELIGTTEEKRAARTAMRRTVLERSGETAAHRFYEGSMLRHVLWARLIANASDEDAARRILALRKRTNVKVGASGEIILDLSALSPSDYSGTTAGILTKELEAEFERIAPPPVELPPIQPDPKDSSEQLTLDLHDDPRRVQSVDHIVRRVRSASRQEERLPALVDAIVQNREIGPELLKTYADDKSQHATKALRVLEAEVQSEAFVANTARDIELVKIIRRPYFRSMPQSRALQFYYIAKYLSKYPHINAYLKKVWARASSIYLRPYQQEIERYLDGK
jgi:hypothetical protein